MGIVEIATAQGFARALKGNLIDLKGTTRLSEAGTIKEVLDYLRSFPYYNKLLFSALDELPVDIGKIERLLNQSIIDDASRIERFLPDDIRCVVEKIIARYELSNIKTILNIINSGQDQSLSQAFLLDMREFKTIEGSKLLNVHSISDVIEALEDTRYGPPLQNAYERYQRDNSLFTLKNALDLFHFEELWDSINLMSPRKRNSILSVLGTEMDLRQIQWILRFRINFKLPPHQTYNHIIHQGYLLDEELLNELSEAQEIEQFIKCLPRAYGRIVENSLNDGLIDFTRLEVASWHYIYEKAVEALYRRPINPGIIFAYLSIKRVETDEIISILECKRYGMPKEDIRRYIIRDDTEF